MANIIRGTTPTIRYTFSNVDASKITAAVLTIRYGSTVLIEKTLSEGIKDEDGISWTLTQEESLSLKVGQTKIRCNWLLNDGTRGASPLTDVSTLDNEVNEVMT